METNFQTAVLLQWQLEPFLKVFHVIFQAALAALPTYPIDAVWGSRTFKENDPSAEAYSLPVWFFSRDRNAARMFGNSLPQDLGHHWESLEQYHHCEHFVLMLLEPLSVKAQGE